MQGQYITASYIMVQSMEEIGRLIGSNHVTDHKDDQLV